MTRIPPSAQGFTLTELIIAVTLLSFVFLAAISMYLTGLRFYGARQAVDISALPDVAVESIVKLVNVANSAAVTLPGSGSPVTGSQLNLRIDYDSCSNTRGTVTPDNLADDFWWHYRFIGNQLLYLCGNTAGAALPAVTLTAVGNPAGTVALLSNLDTASSRFQITNPSSAGSATVISVRVVSTTPLVTVDTEAALGAASKN